MILDIKKRLFCELKGISPREVDANDPLWIQRIDLFFSTRSELPPPGDPTEYAKAFEAIYPTAKDRRIYIEQAVTRGTPSFAHRVLAVLLTTHRIPCIFTTNFDQLVETAATLTDQLMSAGERANMTTAAIDIHRDWQERSLTFPRCLETHTPIDYSCNYFTVDYRLKCTKMVLIQPWPGLLQMYSISMVSY